MKYRRKPAEVHAEQLDPADLKGSIANLDAFIAAGYFDYNLDADTDDGLAAVLTYPHRAWTPVLPGSWVIRWDEGVYTVMDDEEFRMDFEEVPDEG